jgi:hypothetical protein
MPIVVDASSAVSRLHGSMATVPGLPLAPAPPALGDGSVEGDVAGVAVATTTDGLSVPTETGLDDGVVGLPVAGAPPVEQAASASVVTERSDSERFVRMRIETSVSTIDRRR